MSVFKLTYFERRYRPEVVRLLFVVGDIPFEDIRVPGADEGSAPSELKANGSEYNLQNIMIGKFDIIKFDIIKF